MQALVAEQSCTASKPTPTVAAYAPVGSQLAARAERGVLASRSYAWTVPGPARYRRYSGALCRRGFSTAIAAIHQSKQPWKPATEQANGMLSGVGGAGEGHRGSRVRRCLINPHTNPNPGLRRRNGGEMNLHSPRQRTYD